MPGAMVPVGWNPLGWYIDLYGTDEVVAPVTGRRGIVYTSDLESLAALGKAEIKRVQVYKVAPKPKQEFKKTKMLVGSINESVWAYGMSIEIIPATYEISGWSYFDLEEIVERALQKRFCYIHFDDVGYEHALQRFSPNLAIEDIAYEIIPEYKDEDVFMDDPVNPSKKIRARQATIEAELRFGLER